MLGAQACPDDASVVEFVHGLLDDGARASVEAHVADCPACRTLVAELVKLSFAPSVTGAPSLELAAGTPASESDAPAVDAPSPPA